jgi:predicted ATP-grasp superfamily ATP-dependent carboligase
LPKKRPYKIYEDFPIQASTLLICWDSDAGRVGPDTADYITSHGQTYPLGHIDPEDFYIMDGVSVEDNVAQFPDCRFIYYPDSNLVIFSGSPPEQEWYGFLSAIMDVAEKHCYVRRIYTLGGMISVSAHTTSRELLTVANSPEIGYDLSQYDPVTRAIDYYETPPGHRPTINAYLLWAAQRRNIDAACLWVPVPFYLAQGDDPQAIRRILDFLALKVDLDIDFAEINGRITDQNEKLRRLRNENADIDNAISALESNVSISGGDSQNLITTVSDYLKRDMLDNLQF